MNIIPANNVIVAYLAGIISVGLLHYAKVIGYDVPPDIADSLPAGLALLIIHVWESVANKPGV